MIIVNSPYATVWDVVLIIVAFYGAFHWPLFLGGFEWFLLFGLSPSAWG